MAVTFDTYQFTVCTEYRRTNSNKTLLDWFPWRRHRREMAASLSQDGGATVERWRRATRGSCQLVTVDGAPLQPADAPVPVVAPLQQEGSLSDREAGHAR